MIDHPEDGTIHAAPPTRGALLQTAAGLPFGAFMADIGGTPRLIVNPALNPTEESLRVSGPRMRATF